MSADLPDWLKGARNTREQRKEAVRILQDQKLQTALEQKALAEQYYQKSYTALIAQIDPFLDYWNLWQVDNLLQDVREFLGSEKVSNTLIKLDGHNGIYRYGQGSGYGVYMQLRYSSLPDFFKNEPKIKNIESIRFLGLHGSCTSSESRGAPTERYDVDFEDFELSLEPEGVWLAKARTGGDSSTRIGNISNLDGRRLREAVNTYLEKYER